MSLVKILLLLMLVCGAKSECGVRRKNCVKTGANDVNAYKQYRIVPDRSCPMNNQGKSARMPFVKSLSLIVRNGRINLRGSKQIRVCKPLF